VRIAAGRGPIHRRSIKRIPISYPATMAAMTSQRTMPSGIGNVAALSAIAAIVSSLPLLTGLLVSRRHRSRLEARSPRSFQA
jgi:hypothetical protein